MEVNTLTAVQPVPEERRPGCWSSGGLSRSFPLCLALLILAPLTRLLLSSVFFHLSEGESESANLTQTPLTCTNGSLPGSGDGDLLPPCLANGMEVPRKLQETCPGGWTVFRGFCYFFSSQTRSWEASRQSCRRARADLVVVHTPEEQNFLARNIEGHTWIGLTDLETEGTWKWVDGNPLTHGYWRPGQPDNWIWAPNFGDEDCGHLTFTEDMPGNWNDEDCNRSFSWVCKKKLG